MGLSILQASNMSTEQPLPNVSAPPKKKPVFLIRYFTIAYGILWLIAAVFLSGQYNWYWKHVISLAVFYTVMGACMILMFLWLYTLNRKGWALLMLNFTYNVVSLIHSLITIYTQKVGFFKSQDSEGKWFGLFLCGLVFYFFNRKNVLTTFQISRRFQFWVLAISLVAVVTYIYLNRDGMNWNYYYG
jgi:hypothetical protein